MQIYIVLYMCLSLFNFSREDLLHMYYFIVFVQNFFIFFSSLRLYYFSSKTLWKQNGSINRKVISLQKIYKRGYIGINKSSREKLNNDKHIYNTIYMYVRTVTCKTIPSFIPRCWIRVTSLSSLKSNSAQGYFSYLE
jgi:hypothetical protein